jgi:hypothetical protein
MAQLSRYWFNRMSRQRRRHAWFAARQAGNPLLLGAFVDMNVSFVPIRSGKGPPLSKICGNGGRLGLTDLFVIGSDYDTAVITRWNNYDANGNRTQMGSFFRVRLG